MIAIFSYFFFRPSNNGSLVPSASLPANTLPKSARQPGRRLGALLLLAALALLTTGCNAGRNLGASDRGWSPVVAAEGMVYVGTVQGQVLALNDNGSSVSLQWTFPSIEEDFIDGVYNSPVVGPDLVYVAALNGILYALTKDGGKDQGIGWSRVVGNESERAALVGGPVLSPDGQIVLVGSEDGNLYAYDAKTGTPRNGFPFQTGGKIWSTPAVKDGVVYFGSRDKNIYAVDLRSGEEKWRWETGGAVVAQPLLFKDLVVIGSFDKSLYALRAEDGTPVWGGQSFPGLQLFEGAGNWFWAGAVANNSSIFAPAMDGKVYAIDGNGNLRWEQQLGSPIVSTPVLVPLGLIVATRDGEVNRLDVDNGIISGLPRLPSEVKAPLSAPPAIDPANQDFSQVDQSDSVFIGTQDGIVYRLRVTSGQSENLLWCFDTEEKKMLSITECSSAKE